MNVSRRTVIGGLAAAGAGTLGTVFAPSVPAFFQGDAKMASGETLKFRRKLRHWGVLQAAWSPDGKRLVTAGGSYVLWDPHTGEKLHELSSPLVSPTLEGPVRFTADSRHVVVEINARKDDPPIAFALWNAETGKIDQLVYFPWKHFMYQRGGHPWVIPIPGREQAVVAIEGIGYPSNQGNPILIYNTLTWEIEQELIQIPKNGARCFDVSPDGKLLAIGNWRLGRYSGDPVGRIEIFNITSGERVLAVENAHKDTTFHVAFSPDSKLIASSQWEVGGYTRNNLADHLEYMSDPDPVRVWDVATGRKVISFSGPFPGVSNLAFHPTKPWLAASLGTFAGRTKGPEFRIWNWRSGELLTTQGQFSSSAQHIAFSPNGRLVVMAGNNRGLLARDGIEIAEII